MEDAIRMNLRETGWKGVDWIYLVVSCEHSYETFGSIRSKEFLDWLSEQQFISQEGLCSRELVQNWSFIIVLSICFSTCVLQNPIPLICYYVY
jgi:hypothetical protein